ncbi:MAG: D-alanyl-D-alanine carboxypeptidase family protein [Oscillospiraceae bacterium]|nr:D-alanyl-D-alanine carboxypeptidase family protein [Oscillospiraceae bacterium]
MKRLWIALIIAGCLCLTACTDASAETESSATQETQVVTESPATETEEPTETAPAETGLDYLVLVNKQNPLPEDWEKTIEVVHTPNSLGDDVEVEAEAYQAYLQLKEALAAKDVRVDLDSAYRSVAEQQRIVDDFTVTYGEDYVKQYVAVPGYSEHHTGLALDLYLNIDGEDVYLNEDMVEYPEIWAQIHEELPHYGFILRYLEGKEDITGYSYEPWHIRYVGDTAVAEEITAQGITLEEYLGADAGKDTTEEATDASGGDGLYFSNQPVIDSPDWVKELPAAKEDGTKQMFVVAAMGSELTTATISMHEKDADGNWKQILSTPGFVGRNGMVADEERVEGCGKTPIGTYHFNKAFGIADDPGCKLPYTKVDDDTYWSGDSREGMHYNEMVDIKDFPDLDTENSEHLTDYEYEYQYCLNIGFNENGTPNRGSAIFLQCFGTQKPYTGGCVAVPENIMKQIMQCVDPDCVVVIDLFENMNGSF